jgi:hypothetical protein
MLAAAALHGIGGHFFVNCRLLTGQGFVITYVITLVLPAGWLTAAAVQ